MRGADTVAKLTTTAMTGRRKRIRFSLATLLGLTTLIAGLFGYAQWQYQVKMKAYSRLEADGVHLLVAPAKSNWLEYLATGDSEIDKPSEAVIEVVQMGEGEFNIGQDKFTIGRTTVPMSELENEMNARKQRAEELGIPQIRYTVRILHYPDFTEFNAICVKLNLKPKWHEFPGSRHLFK